MSHRGNQPYNGRLGYWFFMLDTWMGGLESGCSTMETGAILVDWDRGSSCWAVWRAEVSPCWALGEGFGEWMSHHVNQPYGGRPG